MTNEEIIQKLRNGEPFDSLGNAIVLTKSDYMDLARSDERTRIIKEIEEWVFNSVPSANALSTSITISGGSTKTVMEILTKLNAIRTELQ